MADADATMGDAPPSSRLMITKMVLENFKSYGGVREIGPFHKRFSSVVGPNGSGKSNVIDAMLFVFGKRAKKLRLNKVSELIHRSEAYPNLDSARVSDLWMSSDTLLSRSFLARLPKTKSIASMTLDLPEPFGPTTLEKRLWKGPISRTPP